MTDLLRRPYTGPDRDGCILVLTPASAGWDYVGSEVLRLVAGQTTMRDLEDREACVVAIEGRCEIRAGGPWGQIGRASFDAAPDAFYVPPRHQVEIRAMTAAEIAIGSAPAAGGAGESRSLPASGARRELRGTGAMQRTIHQILMEDQPASSLLVTEVVTPAGHWSSFPPHKHDTDDPPRESKLEEIYYFRFRDPRGFGVMRVYTRADRPSGGSDDPDTGRSARQGDGPLDESIAVRDGDLVIVPRGYHTFSAAPGYEAYYLNVMAGPRREWKITFDPDHERMRW